MNRTYYNTKKNDKKLYYINKQKIINIVPKHVTYYIHYNIYGPAG